MNALSISQEREAELRQRARAVHKWRRARDLALGEAKTLFGEPAWDLMLDLYARGRGRHTSVLGACHGSATPITTALRRIGRLERSGLIERERDGNDGRRCWLNLTRAGEELMTGLLDRLNPTDAPASHSLGTMLDRSPVVALIERNL